MNNEWLRKGFGLIGIMLFIGAFFWVGDVHSYLDQHYWHFDHVERGEVLKFSVFGWLFSWVAAFIASSVPFLLTGIVAAHFYEEEVKQKEQAELELAKAKRASNLYINTNVTASAETPC